MGEKEILSIDGKINGLVVFSLLVLTFSLGVLPYSKAFLPLGVDIWKYGFVLKRYSQHLPFPFSDIGLSYSLFVFAGLLKATGLPVQLIFPVVPLLFVVLTVLLVYFISVRVANSSMAGVIGFFPAVFYACSGTSMFLFQGYTKNLFGQAFICLTFFFVLLYLRRPSLLKLFAIATAASAAYLTHEFSFAVVFLTLTTFHLLIFSFERDERVKKKVLRIFLAAALPLILGLFLYFIFSNNLGNLISRYEGLLVKGGVQAGVGVTSLFKMFFDPFSLMTSIGGLSIVFSFPGILIALVRRDEESIFLLTWFTCSLFFVFGPGSCLRLPPYRVMSNMALPMCVLSAYSLDHLYSMLVNVNRPGWRKVLPVTAFLVTALLLIPSLFLGYGYYSGMRPFYGGEELYCYSFLEENFVGTAVFSLKKDMSLNKYFFGDFALQFEEMSNGSSWPSFSALMSYYKANGRIRDGCFFVVEKDKVTRILDVVPEEQRGRFARVLDSKTMQAYLCKG